MKPHSGRNIIITPTSGLIKLLCLKKQGSGPALNLLPLTGRIINSGIINAPDYLIQFFSKD
jgi:hypothetical protein